MYFVKEFEFLVSFVSQFHTLKVKEASSHSKDCAAVQVLEMWSWISHSAKIQMPASLRMIPCLNKAAACPVILRELHPGISPLTLFVMLGNVPRVFISRDLLARI